MEAADVIPLVEDIVAIAGDCFFLPRIFLPGFDFLSFSSADIVASVCLAFLGVHWRSRRGSCHVAEPKNNKMERTHKGPGRWHERKERKKILVLVRTVCCCCFVLWFILVPPLFSVIREERSSSWVGKMRRCSGRSENESESEKGREGRKKEDGEECGKEGKKRGKQEKSVIVEVRG